MKLNLHAFTKLLCSFLVTFSGCFAYAGTLFVANKSSDSVTLFQESTLSKIAEIPTGRHPHEVALATDGHYAMISNYGSGFEPGSTLTVIDVAKRAVARTIQLPPKARPHGIYFLNASQALVTAEGIQSLLLVNVETGKIEHSLPLPGKGAHLLTVDRAQEFAYIANAESGTVTKVDLLTQRVVAEQSIGKASEGIVLSADEETLLVSNRKDSLVAFLRASDLSLLSTTKTGNGPIRLALFDHGASAVMTNSVGGTFQTLDVESGAILKTVKTTNSFSFESGSTLGGLFGILSVPITVLVRDDQETAYISNSFAGNITLVNLKTGEILKTFAASKEPDGMALLRD